MLLRQHIASAAFLQERLEEHENGCLDPLSPWGLLAKSPHFRVLKALLANSLHCRILKALRLADVGAPI